MNEHNTSELITTATPTTSSPSKTTKERIEAGERHIKFHEQVIFIKKGPDPECKHCLGVGHLGTWREKPQPTLSLTRNDKCPCGSEKKFKKCCMNLVNRMRYSGSSIMTCGCVGKAELGENPEMDEMKDQLARLHNRKL